MTDNSRTASEESRFEELKAKGWANLSKEERAEYIALKEPLSTTPIPEPTKEETKETVTVKKEELMKMVEEIAEAKIQKLREENQELKQHSLSLEQQVGLGNWKDVGEVKDRKHTATFKMWRATTDDPWNIIVDWKHLRFDYDEQTRGYDKDIYKLTLQDDKGNESNVELTLKEFSNIVDVETVDIVKMDKKEQVMKLGQVRRSAQRDGYTYSALSGLSGLKLSNDSQPWVDQLVTRDRIICTVRRPNGLQFQINSDRLNA